MAIFGGLGKALGLGSAKDVAKFATNVATTFASGGVIPIQTSPFEKSEPQIMQFYTNDPGLSGTSNVPVNLPSNNSNSFLGGLGQQIGSFGSNIGGFFQDISPFTSLFGGGQSIPKNQMGPAVTVNTQGPQETSSSGELLGASLGLGGALLAQGAKFLKTPAGGSLLGLGAGALGASMGSGGGSAPRITRRMKSDVRRIYMMSGMNPNITAQILNNMGTYPRFDFNASLVFFILTKRFRNDGPVVTKAAVRKTRTTLRRMKGVVDTYNSVCKPTTRRAPMKRATRSAVQLIKN